MIEEVGQICAIEKDASGQIIWVETQIKSTCGSCEAQSNCGTGAIAKVFARKTERLRFRWDESVTLGQKVSLGIPEENLLKAAMLVYLLPLVVLVVSALIATASLPWLGLQSELWTIGVAALCTYAAMRLSAVWLNRGNKQQYSPRILQVLPFEPQSIQCKQL